MAAPVLNITRRQTILILELNRPHVRNAVNRQLADAIADALDRLDADDGLRVGILTGAGAGFSAGMDLRSFLDEGEPLHPERGFAGIVERPPRKPLIAAIEGFAVAGGFEIALSCDLVVAARDARIALPEVKRSLVATGGGLLRLAKRVPYQVAVEIALTGDAVPVERLHEVGLIARVAAPGEALVAALALADSIAANAPLAVAASKRVLEGALDWKLAEGWANQRAFSDAVERSQDAQEGSRAFLEKREPVWSGR